MIIPLNVSAHNSLIVVSFRVLLRSQIHAYTLVIKVVYAMHTQGCNFVYKIKLS